MNLQLAVSNGYENGTESILFMSECNFRGTVEDDTILPMDTYSA